MYRIGEFSEKTGLSIRTLRYYDEINILNPDEIDIYTGYRYYTDKKIEEVNIIKELKNIGFTLEEIKEYWNNFNDEIMLNQKQKLLQEVELMQEKIKKVDHLRQYIHNGKFDFSVKKEIKIKSKF